MQGKNRPRDLYRTKTRLRREKTYLMKKRGKEHQAEEGKA